MTRTEFTEIVSGSSISPTNSIDSSYVRPDLLFTPKNKTSGGGVEFGSYVLDDVDFFNDNNCSDKEDG